MPNATTAEFIIALKQAVENYRQTTILPVQVAGFLGYRSLDTRMLMDEIDGLSAWKEQESLVTAVEAIIKYIHNVGTSDNPSRGFWVKALQPCLEKYAQDPLTDVSDENKKNFSILEMTEFPCSPQIVRQRGMLFNALGSQQRLANHFHLDFAEGITTANRKMNEAIRDYAERKQNGMTPGAARILQATFACTQRIPGNILAFATDEQTQNSEINKYQRHTLLQMLDKIDHDELLIFLRRLNKHHLSINDAMPSFLYKIADRKQAQDALAPPQLPFIELPPIRYAREAKLDKLTQTSIDCLKELRRISPHFDFKTIHHKLYAIITGDAQHTFASEPISNADMANAIAARPLWRNELANEGSTISIRELVLTVPALEILYIINPAANTRTSSTGDLRRG